MSEEGVINCTLSHEIHQYVFSCVYILILLVSEHLDMDNDQVSRLLLMKC